MLKESLIILLSITFGIKSDSFFIPVSRGLYNARNYSLTSTCESAESARVDEPKPERVTLAGRAQKRHFRRRRRRWLLREGASFFFFSSLAASKATRCLPVNPMANQSGHVCAPPLLSREPAVRRRCNCLFNVEPTRRAFPSSSRSRLLNALPGHSADRSGGFSRSFFLFLKWYTCTANERMNERTD